MLGDGNFDMVWQNSHKDEFFSIFCLVAVFGFFLL